MRRLRTERVDGMRQQGTGVTVRPARLLIVDPQLAGQLAELDSALLETAADSLDVVRREAARLRRMAGEGTRTREPCTVVYRLASGGHQQTGVVVDVSIDDYRNGHIRRHEAIRPERERRLGELLDAAQVELVPVTLTHRARPRLRSLFAEVAAGEPDVRVMSDDGHAQTVWIKHDPELAQAIQAELAGVDALYIADGHHRMAVAERHAARRHQGEGDSTADFVLGALFPCDEMRLLGYHRALTLPDGMPASGLLAALADQPGAERIEELTGAEAARAAPGVVVVWLDGRWYRLRLRAPRDPVNVRSSLDVVALDERVLAPLLRVADFGSHGRVTTLPGTSDAHAVARWCAAHRAAGFVLHPPSVEHVMALADAGLVMPPKSTWFDPKARAGLFLRALG